MSQTQTTIDTTGALVGTEWPGVGLGVIVIRDGKVLIGHRGQQSSHGRGVWGFPGGKLDFGETWEACAIRETLEETGLRIGKVRFGTVTNDLFRSEGRHFVTIYMLGDAAPDGEAQVLEPGKTERWEWHAWADLPRPLFLPIQSILHQGYSPFARQLQVGVKALIRDSQKRILLLRKDRPFKGHTEAAWELPGGRLEPGEPTLEALGREIREETGLVVTVVGRLLAAQDILDNPSLHVVRLTYDVSVTGTLTLNHSDTSATTHDAYRWTSPSEFSSLPLDRYLREALPQLLAQVRRS